MSKRHIIPDPKRECVWTNYLNCLLFCVERITKSIIPKLFKGITFVLFNCVVPYTTEIGEDTKFAYGGMGCVIHSRAKIGDRVLIGQNTTIGRSLDPEDIPTIGNDGNPADMETIQAFCVKENIYLIDDAAQAFGSSLNNKMIGSFGNAGLFSFSSGKPTLGHMGCYFWSENQDYHIKRTNHKLYHKIEKLF